MTIVLPTMTPVMICSNSVLVTKWYIRLRQGDKSCKFLIMKKSGDLPKSTFLDLSHFSWVSVRSTCTPVCFKLMKLSTITPTLKFNRNMKLVKMYITKNGAKSHCWVSRFGSSYGCRESTAAYITSTQPSVDEISKRVSNEFQMLSKFWSKDRLQVPPCSAQRAASFISGSQKSSH